MKYFLTVLALLFFGGLQAQTIVGTWQQVEKRTCLDSQFTESDTEKELLGQMGPGGQTLVARLIRFDTKGNGEEGIFSAGRKKGMSLNPFKYSYDDGELNLFDKKSGIITYRFVVDTLTDHSLRFHDAMKDCEARRFTRVK